MCFSYPKRGATPLLLALLSGFLALWPQRAQPEKVAITPPDWLRSGVVYEVFPRDFSPQGNFDGVTARLDDLQRLGVNILWLMPIHPIGQKMRKGALGSPYSVRDYYAINRDYGTADDLKRLIFEAHKRDMKVIMDLVANHTAWDSVLTAHPEYYKQDGAGRIIPPNPAWTDVAGLNYNNPELRRYMIAMMQHWIDPAGFDFDGFRCDVAGEVPVSFWEEARIELVKTKPDIMMLAEASKPDLMVHAFDIDYSWPLLTTLNHVMRDGAPASDLARTWEQTRREFPEGALHLRISDDHDEPRAIARYGLNGALAASVLMFTLDGVPLLYNGMEAGDATESGDPALFEKLPIFWHPKDRPDFFAIYHSFAALRRRYAAFRTDNVTWLHCSDASDVLCFQRGDARDEFVVVINFSNRRQKVAVDAPRAKDFTPVRIDGVAPPNDQSLAGLQLGSFEWRIFHRVVTPSASASLTQ